MSPGRQAPVWRTVNDLRTVHVVKPTAQHFCRNVDVWTSGSKAGCCELLRDIALAANGRQCFTEGDARMDGSSRHLYGDR